MQRHLRGIQFGYLAMALLLLASCSDDPGLSAIKDSGGAAAGAGGSSVGVGGMVEGTGGSGVGGAHGSGGVVVDAGEKMDATGSGGDARVSDVGPVGTPDLPPSTDSGLACGPVCAIACAYGNVLDDKGCPTCACNPAPADAGTRDTSAADAGPDGVTCGPVCTVYCPYGNETDGKGCPTCTCNPPPIDGGRQDAGLADAGRDAVICGPVCEIYCPYGNVVDNNGCPTCACNPAPVCVAEPCPSCPNGYVKDANGCSTCTCAPDPNLACNQRSNETQCTGSTKCQWLVPGCDTPALSTPGCYDVSAINCTADKDCSGGLACVQRSIDPCHNLNCAACGRSIGICL